MVKYYTFLEFLMIEYDFIMFTNYVFPRHPLQLIYAQEAKVLLEFSIVIVAPFSKLKFKNMGYGFFVQCSQYGSTRLRI